jgi:hypothetical protein
MYAVEVIERRDYERNRYVGLQLFADRAAAEAYAAECVDDAGSDDETTLRASVRRARPGDREFA